MRPASLLLVPALALLLVPASAMAIAVDAGLVITPDELTAPAQPTVTPAAAAALDILEDGGMVVCDAQACWLRMPDLPVEPAGPSMPMTVMWCQALECSPLYVVRQLAESSADSALAFGSQLAADVEAKEGLVHGAAIAVTYYAYGQANGTRALAEDAARGAAPSADEALVAGVVFAISTGSAVVTATKDALTCACDPLRAP